MAFGAAEGDAEDVDHADIMRVIWRKKWLIAAIALILTCAAGAVIYSLPRHYSAEALIVIGSRDGTSAFVSSNGTTNIVPKADPETVQTEIEILQSPALAAEVVQNLHLQDRPEFNPYLAAEGGKADKAAPSFTANIYAWAQGIVGSVIPSLAEPPVKHEASAATQLTATIGNLLGRLRVGTKGASRVVSVEIGSGDPEMAANVVNSLIDNYFGDQIANRTRTAADTEHWLDQRTAQLRAKVEQSEKAVEDFRSSQQLYSGPGGTSLASTQLAEVETELARAQATTAALVEGRGRKGSEARTSLLTSSSPLLVTLQTQEADIERQLATSSADLGERNPTILGLRASLRDTKSRIAGERSKLAGTSAGSIESRIRVARAAEQALKERQAKLERDVGRTGLAGVTLHALERELAANRIVLENFLARSVEMAHQGDATARHLEAEIISRASVPTSPDKPNRPMLLIIAVACSLIFSIAVALLLEKTKRGFRSLEEIEAITRTSVLGLVPFVGAARTSPLAVSRNAGSSYYASIRSIWTTLSLMLQKESKFILVTSALPQEGKTTLALSLAAMAGHGGHRTVLVDVDFWRGCASAALGLGSSSGFAELLDGKAEFDDVVVSDIGAGIDIIRPGTLPRGYDIAMKDKLVRLMNQLASRYEYIIIDCPPILAISEMLFLASYADATILAVRWNHTPRGAANLALRRLREARAPLQGVVLTMVDERKHAQSGRAESAYFSKDVMNYYAQGTMQPYAPLSIPGPEQRDGDPKPKGAGAMRSVLRRIGRMTDTETRIPSYDRPRWAILVVDVQEDLIARSGWSGLSDTAPTEFLDTINRVSKAAWDHGALVVYTRQEFDTAGGKLASRLFFHGAGSKGAPDNRIHPRVDLLSNYQFSKAKWNAFSSVALDNFLRANRIDHLCLLGLDGVGSIDDTARSAIERGYRVTFISDCIATPFKRDWAELLSGFEDDRAFAVTSRQFLDRLDARDPIERTPKNAFETSFPAAAIG